jgi:hypothetical protein
LIRSSSAARFVLYGGAAGTVVLVVMGCFRALQRLVERDALVEAPIVIAMWLPIAAWMLSPYWGALKLQRRAMPLRITTIISVLAAVLVCAVGANSFLVTSAFVGGRARPTADGVTIMFAPGLQWLVVGIAMLLTHLLITRSTRRETLANKPRQPTSGGEAK